VTDVSCQVFGTLTALEPDVIHCFVVGEDPAPRPMAPDEAAQELGDPFATLLLLKGTFPQTGADVMARFKEAVGDDDPLGKQRSFVLGEGSQLLPSEAADSVQRGMRFVVATESGPDGPDVIISAFHPDDGSVELMAWDRTSGGFNYYRTVGQENAWVFAGNSRHALSDPTQGKGPFESHTSGAILMKELQIPWVHWHSFEAPMPPTVFPEGDARRTHPWFTEKDGAEVCETEVAIPSIARWARVRFDRMADGGTVQDPRRVLEQVLGTPTVNLISSRAESHDPDAKGGVKIPPTFFVNSEALTKLTDQPTAPGGEEPPRLAAPPEFTVATEIYTTSLETFEFTLSDGEGFEQPGDTKFAFTVPERAREDDVVVSEAIRIGLITARLAAALLMVDFPNPIFSARRQQLLAHVPASATITGGASSFSQEMADGIRTAAESTPDGSPEREFAERWDVGESFVDPFNALLGAYFDAVGGRLATQDGFDDYVRLAESRRMHVRGSETLDVPGMPIFENPLLFPTTNIPDAERMMRADGTVVETNGAGA
jgi:hypothetical protein